MINQREHCEYPSCQFDTKCYIKVEPPMFSLTTAASVESLLSWHLKDFVYIFFCLTLTSFGGLNLIHCDLHVTMVLLF